VHSTPELCHRLEAAVRAHLVIVLLLAGCSVERALEPATAAQQAVAAPAHQLLVLSLEPARSEVSYARRVEGPLPVPRAVEPLPWRVALTDAQGAPLYETRVARADRVHARFHEGEATVPRERFVLLVRLPLTPRPARLSVFDGDVLVAPPVEVPR